MIVIFSYIAATLAIIYLLSFGLTNILLPKNIRSYAILLAPWYLIIFLIFSLTVLSLMGIPVTYSSPIVILLLIILDLYVLQKTKIAKIYSSIDLKEITVIFSFILVNIVFNLRPLITTHKYLTTISMGNNDVILYATVPDYLINHSISESFRSNVDPEIGDLLKYGYRWGTPIIASFFQNILQLQGYQFAYFFQVILFSLIIPLVYAVFKMLLNKKTFSFYLLPLFFLIGFNSNLLYMLYHDFFGQILFWGIELFILIHIFDYFQSENNETKKIYNSNDFIIGIGISSLYFTYHEGIIFVVLPLLLFSLFKFLKNITNIYLLKIMKIASIVLLTAPISLIRAIVFDISQAQLVNGPIGWQVFRNSVPFANPFEVLGLYSIHSFEAMNILPALLLSIVVVVIALLGLYHSRWRTLISSYLLVYLLFYIWTAVISRNFWAYNKAITYTLFLYVILFVIGIIKIIDFRKSFKKYLVFLLVIISFYNAFKLNKRFMSEHLTVDKSYISLLELKNTNIKEPIYTENYINPNTLLWRQIWSKYFISKVLSDNNIIEPVPNQPTDGSLVILAKKNTGDLYSKVIINKKLWENEYYLLGRICLSNSCLLKSQLE